MRGFIKQNYHWLVALLVFLEAVIIGGLVNCYSVFTIPICQDLQVSRGNLSLAGTLYIVSSFLSTMATALYLRRQR